MSASAPRRREWLPELSVLLGLAAVTTLLFAVTPLDLTVARLFYRPAATDRWPLARAPLAAALYGAAPPVTASLVLIGLGMVAAGSLRGREMLRRHGVFLLLAVVVGPGLVINAVFKDHWQRPRPRDVVELGGPLRYVPPLARGAEGGGSFPCGHCSVGFLYGTAWWMWKDRRRVRAAAGLAAGLVAGSAIGFGRMAAGGHFLSDVVWSALLAFGIAHGLYYHMLRIPRHRRALEAGAPLTRHRTRDNATAILAVLGGVAVLLALFVTPHGTPLAEQIPLATLAPTPRAFELVARRTNVEIDVVDGPDVVVIRGELHGFGPPGSRLDARAELDPEPVPTLRYRITQRGWFTDLDGEVAIRLPAGALQRIAVHLEHGNIRVSDHTRAGAVVAGRITLDLATASGHVQAPDRAP